jgi:hypothetical protein
VNEIDQDCHLVTLKSKPNPASIPHKSQQNKPTYTMSEEVEQKVVGYFGKDTAKALSDLYGKLEVGEKIGQWEHLVENMAPLTKDERKGIH